jgi:cell division protein FtsZ
MTTPGHINRDFSDIRATMAGMGYAMMGTATAKGENAAAEAARGAINSPLLEDVRIAGSRGILINITGSAGLGLHEVNDACNIIREAADYDEVQIYFGVTQNDSMGDAVKITVIATGFQPEDAPVAIPADRRPIDILAETQLASFYTDPEPVAEAEPEPEMAAEPEEEPEPVYDPDDLDTPAFMRQGRLIN